MFNWNVRGVASLVIFVLVARLLFVGIRAWRRGPDELSVHTDLRRPEGLERLRQLALRKRRMLMSGMVIVAVLAAIGVGWVLHGGGSNSPQGPPRPVWVNPDGSLNPEKVPGWVGVLRGDGTDAFWGWARGPDVVLGGDGPIYVYDHPNGTVIGQIHNVPPSGTEG